MRRPTRFIPLLLALFAALLLAPAALAGESGSQPQGPPGGDPQGEHPSFGPPPLGFPGLGLRVFRGEVLSVDAEQGTITALVAPGRHPGKRPPRHQGPGGDEGDRPGGDRPGPGGPQGGPAKNRRNRPPLRKVTFHTDEDTTVLRNGEEAQVGELQEGDLLMVAIEAEPGSSIEEILATPAWFVSAYGRPAFYGFGGKVTGVNTEGGTLTLEVRRATRAARQALREAGVERGSEVTFLTSEDTRIVVDGDHGELGGIEPGDHAGVGIMAAKGASLEELQGTPASIVLASKHKRAGPAASRLARRAARAARRAHRR